MSKKIFCFPCAGGNAGNFNEIIKDFEWDAYSVEYSGHWTRYDEGLYVSMKECVENLYMELISDITEKDEVFLMGHSMGAIIVYEIARYLLTHGYDVKAIFLLACMPPNEMEYSNFEFKNDCEIKEFLGRIRQISENVLNSNFFEDNLLPAIRNDFRILGDYAKECHQNKVAADIICIEGTEDPLVPDMKGWEQYTSASFRCISCEGNHFFLYDSQNIGIIKEAVSSTINC